jgi:hypothetical protein
MFGLIGVTGLFVQAVRIADEGRPAFEEWAYIGYGLAWFFHTMTPSALNTLHPVLW